MQLQALIRPDGLIQKRTFKFICTLADMSCQVQKFRLLGTCFILASLYHV